MLNSQFRFHDYLKIVTKQGLQNSDCHRSMLLTSYGYIEAKIIYIIIIFGIRGNVIFVRVIQ